MAEMFTVEIICPDRTFYTGQCQMVEFNSKEGRLGVYPNHAPITTVLAPGMVTLHEEGEAKHAALHSGFATILPDKVTLLAEIAEWPEEIDLDRARAAKERAEERLAKNDGNIDVLRAEAALKKALTRLEVKNGI